MAIHKALDSDFARGGRVVYVIESNADDALATADAVRSLGHVAYCFGNPDDVIASIKLRRPDLILIDLSCSRKVLTLLASDETYEALPRVVLIPSQAADIDVYEGFHYGADLVLAKPLQIDELSRVLAML